MGALFTLTVPFFADFSGSVFYRVWAWQVAIWNACSLFSSVPVFSFGLGELSSEGEVLSFPVGLWSGLFPCQLRSSRQLQGVVALSYRLSKGVGLLGCFPVSACLVSLGGLVSWV